MTEQVAPTRLRIMKGLSALLEGITIANGFRHDLTPFDDDGLLKPRVARGRAVFSDDDPLPLVSILEMPQPPQQVETNPGNTKLSGPWDLIVQGWVEDDKANPTDPAQLLLADVKKALILERATLGATPAMRTYAPLGCKEVTDIKISVGVVRPPDETSAKAFFWLMVTLDVTEDLANPFA